MAARASPSTYPPGEGSGTSSTALARVLCYETFHVFSAQPAALAQTIRRVCLAFQRPCFTAPSSTQTCSQELGTNLRLFNRYPTSTFLRPTMTPSPTSVRLFRSTRRPSVIAGVFLLPTSSPSGKRCSNRADLLYPLPDVLQDHCSANRRDRA